MNKPIICGYCRFWRYEDMEKDGVCCCPESSCFGDITKQEHKCAEYWACKDGTEGYRYE